MMSDIDVLLRYMEDLARKAESKGAACSKFLTPAERAEVERHFASRRDVSLSMEGGFAGSERTIAVFVNTGWGELDLEGELAAVRISYRQSDVLGHRDVLGALMGLGIERAVVGDILCEKPPAHLVCLAGMAGYIVENLIKIGRVGVVAEKVSLDSLPEKKEILKMRSVTVASLRLDAVLSAAFRVSRSEASELVTAGRVMVNHLPCDTPAKEIPEGALLSVKGLGRVKLSVIGGESKKGRKYIEVGTY